MHLSLGIGFQRRLNSAHPFTPTDLGGALLAWWNADRTDLMTLIGSQVSSWRDIVGGYDAAQAVSGARPLYSATNFNGAPGIAFDGIDDNLAMTNQPATFPAGATPGEIWSLCQQDALVADATNRTLVGFGSTGSSSRRVTRTSSGGTVRAQVQVGDGSGLVSKTGTVVDFTGRHLVRLLVEATQMSLALDGNALADPTAVVAATIASRLRIGAAPSSSAALFWSGQIRDLIFTGPLSDAQAYQLALYLMSRRMP